MATGTFADCAEFVSKLSPKKGEIIVFQVRDQHSLEALEQAQVVYNQMSDLAREGKLDGEIPVVIIYGQDRLELMAAECVGSMYVDALYGYVFRPAGYETSQRPAATVYRTRDGQLITVPAK